MSTLIDALRYELHGINEDNHISTILRAVDPIINDIEEVLMSNGVGGSSVLTASLTLTSAQIKQLFTTPVQIVAAPGANQLIVPIMAAAKFTYIAPAYVQSLNDLLIVTYNGYDGAHGQPLQLSAATGDISDPTLLTGTVDAVSLADHEASWNIPAANSINMAMVVAMTGHNPTTGNGTMSIILNYNVVSL